MQLLLHEEDTLKLRFLWFKDASNELSVVGYRICIVQFGLRYSPFLLMIYLYFILVVGAANDPPDLNKFKLALYDLAYVDNLSCTENDEYLVFSYRDVHCSFQRVWFRVAAVRK